MNIQYKSVRTIDSFGRIVLPAELRNMLSIGAYDKLIITVSDGVIYLTKEES